MTQLFIGVKPSVGPVVKVLKYDTDNPLTLANTAYDRYYFNSEVQNLSYVGNAELWVPRPDLATGYHKYGGSGSAFKYLLTVINNSSTNSSSPSGNIKNIFGGGFVGIPECRVRDSNGRIAAGRREIFWRFDSASQERAIITSAQFPAALFKVKEFKDGLTGSALASSRHNGIIHTGFRDQGFAIGDWISMYGSGYEVGVGSEGRNFPTGAAGYSGASSLTTVFWNLPATQAAMPIYNSAPNKEVLVMSASRVVMSRPGFSVDESEGVNQRIFDSDLNPSLCIMHGETSTIAASSSVTIPAPSGLTLSEHTVVDMMVRGVGGPQYIPPFVPSGYMRNNWMNYSYKINPTNIQIFNEGSDSIIVRYLVFDADMTPPSTGGSQIMFKGNDGSRDYIQIKRPGTSDPASKVNDIILDTRYPMLQIVKEGFIPLSSFSTSGVENATSFGNRQHTVSFENNGFLPFVKYTLVCPNVCLSPVMTQAYNYTSGGGPVWGPPSNQSSLCRLTNNSAKFWISPGNWSGMSTVPPYDYIYDCPDPLGIRYYIFGIAT